MLIPHAKKFQWVTSRDIKEKGTAGQKRHSGRVIPPPVPIIRTKKKITRATSKEIPLDRYPEVVPEVDPTCFYI